MDIIEIDISTRSWVDSASDRGYWRVLVNAALNFRIPLTIELKFIAITVFFISKEGHS